MNQIKTLPQAPQGLVNPVAGSLSVTPAALIQRVKDIDEVRREVMIENIHYYSLDADTVPNEKRKWSLGKAGAEVLNLSFGLCADCQSEVVYDDNEVAHTFRKKTKRWFDGPRGRQFEWEEEDITIKGRYEVKATCHIYSASGNLLASASGSANSWESAFRSTAYADSKNPVLKRAEKRAYVAATLLATASSSLFAQDLEELPKAEPLDPQGLPQPQSKSQPTGAGGWMSEPQKKLIFARAKKASLNEDVAKHMIETLNSLPKPKGKPVFDTIADGKPEADGYWKRAMEGVEKTKAAQNPPPTDPAGDPGPEAPEGAPASDTNGTAE